MLAKIKQLRLLKKSNKILRQIDRLYRRKKKDLDHASQTQIELALLQLQEAILAKEASRTPSLSHNLQKLADQKLAKSVWEKGRDYTLAIVFALIVAVVIRQMWFELYTIPTGSMRPTLKEGDFLCVSKTSYGLNVPLTTSHFHFDQNLVKRGDIVVFTGEGMDIPDSDTVYFYLFPGKKQFVKRLIGKPGDTLYFYGGQIYGFDSAGNELSDLLTPEWFQKNEHVPFIRFDGHVETPTQTRGFFSPAIFYQMNEPIAEMKAPSPRGPVTGSMLSSNGKLPISDYNKLWGIGNFAMARILTPVQVGAMHPNQIHNLASAPLYLELTHHPSLKNGQIIRDEMNRLRPDLSYSTSLIPLTDEHINRIAQNMTTCRFIVENGVAHRYGYNAKDRGLSRYFPRLTGVPNGTYEIQNGKASQVFFGGITKELPPTHPLYQSNPERVQLLYNLGIEFLTYYSPHKENRAFPSRYAYFRDHSLYLMGAPIILQDDPVLNQYIDREIEKRINYPSYQAFIDRGAPLDKEGKLDREFIETYGVAVPPDSYLVLGDNHAMSGDSRQFGFVPQNNLKGTVRFLFWPPGSRWGFLSQPSRPCATFPHFFVWGTALAIAAGFSYYVKRRYGRPLTF